MAIYFLTAILWGALLYVGLPVLKGIAEDSRSAEERESDYQASIQRAAYKLYLRKKELAEAEAEIEEFLNV